MLKSLSAFKFSFTIIIFGVLTYIADQRIEKTETKKIPSFFKIVFTLFTFVLIPQVLGTIDEAALFAEFELFSLCIILAIIDFPIFAQIDGYVDLPFDLVTLNWSRLYY